MEEKKLQAEEKVDVQEVQIRLETKTPSGIKNMRNDINAAISRKCEKKVQREARSEGA